MCNIPVSHGQKVNYLNDFSNCVSNFPLSFFAVSACKLSTLQFRGMFDMESRRFLYYENLLKPLFNAMIQNSSSWCHILWTPFLCVNIQKSIFQHESSSVVHNTYRGFTMSRTSFIINACWREKLIRVGQFSVALTGVTS